MKFFRHLQACLALLVLIVAPQTSLASCHPYSADVPGLFGGRIDMDGYSCGTYASVAARYVNFSANPGVSLNGQIQMDLILDDPYYPNFMTIIYYGGPVRVSIQSIAFEVYFNTLTFNLNLGAWGTESTTVSGGITVEGEYIPADLLFLEMLM